MHICALFLLIPTLSFARIPPLEHYLNEKGGNSQWEESEEVIQPPRPKNRHQSYDIRLFTWTTNVTNFFDLNDMNTTIPQNNVDVGIICRTERSKVVVRLVPSQYADACNYDGGVVAHCPDFNRIPLIYANTREPGDYILTTFSDGTTEGLHSTSGGYCAKGLKFPLKIVNNTRDSKRFVLEEPRRPPAKIARDTTASASPTYLCFSLLLFLLVL